MSIEVSTEPVFVKYNESSSKNWSFDQDINSLFLRTIFNHLNDKLRIRGHLFLNEVFDELALPRTSQGALTGWLYSGEPNKPLFEYLIPKFDSEEIVLKINIQGVIYDKI